MIYTLTLNPALDRELSVPEITFNHVLRSNTLRVDYGGKGFNVSRALAALHVESVAVGFIGGLTGQRIADGLNKAGIGTDLVQIAGETRTNISIVSQSQAHHIKVNERGPVITATEQDMLLRKIGDLAAVGDWWVLSGSLPPGVRPAIYAEIIKTVQAAGARVLLDTSGPPLRYGCETGPFLAKPNIVEAAELTGMPLNSPDEAGEAVRAIHALGVKNVLISLGKAGALLSDGETVWLAKPPEIEEHNPVGAGDAMVGGFMGALYHNLALVDALRWGIASGTAAASLNGTAMGSKEFVESLVEQVEVTAL